MAVHKNLDEMFSSEQTIAALRKQVEQLEKNQVPENCLVVPKSIPPEIEKVGWNAFNSQGDMYYIYRDMVLAASKLVK